MSQPTPVRLVVIGCGNMARHHIKTILRQPETTRIDVVCEPSSLAYQQVVEIFAEAGQTPPPNRPDLADLLAEFGPNLDAAFIITPHAFHHDQAQACMEAGLDVLLEKPMVINAAEAESLIATRDRTGRLLVVAFTGSLSPAIRRAVYLLRTGELGKLLSIAAVVWQDWGPRTVGSWRQKPDLSGGGFLFDTGAHMLNTVVDLAGEGFVEVAAWLDNRGHPVEIMGTIMGRLRSGAMVTMHACGESIPTFASDVHLFTSQAIIRTGVWGERLEIQAHGETAFQPVPLPASSGVWEQFLAVRAGRLTNPCPPEVGLRMARLWDAIRASAAREGEMIKL